MIMGSSVLYFFILNTRTRLPEKDGLNTWYPEEDENSVPVIMLV
jgi:hypothetical protein